MAILTSNELAQIGFKSIGENVSISSKASFHNPELISIGSNVRIDDFCILSGQITLGNYIHISAFSAFYGRFGIEMEDFTGVSPRTTVFSASDDFSGEHMIGPMVPEKFTQLRTGKVLIKRFSQIGVNSVIMPGVTIDEGTAVGAMSFVNRNSLPWSIIAGCPAKLVGERSRNILNLYPQI